MVFLAVLRDPARLHRSTSSFVPAKLLGVLAMFASILVWFFLPWLDKCPVRSGHYRPLFRKFFWFGLIPTMVVLAICGGAPAEEPYVMISQIATAYYFLHFLVILPIISLDRTARSAAVLDHRSGAGLGQEGRARRKRRAVAS